MKRIFITLIPVLAFLFILASCSKTRTCRCTYPDGIYDDYPVVSDSKGPANKACDIWQERYHPDMGVSCKIR